MLLGVGGGLWICGELRQGTIDDRVSLAAFLRLIGQEHGEQV
jgi:hypothetical protein